ncbi:hypothetical protein CP99DC5_1168B, partial [Chlamydia psittaci 99DC5]
PRPVNLRRILHW